jgi:hypothetical protein
VSGRIVALDLDRSRCSLCGEPNACVLERRARGETVDDPCWCVGRIFPAALTERARERDGGASCICEVCLEAAAENESR